MTYISNFDNGWDGLYPPRFTTEFVVRRPFPPTEVKKKSDEGSESGVKYPTLSSGRHK
jgi:hypothetical protein